MQITDFVIRLNIMTNRKDLFLNICVLCASRLHRKFRCEEYVEWPALKCVQFVNNVFMLYLLNNFP